MLKRNRHFENPYPPGSVKDDDIFCMLCKPEERIMKFRSYASIKEHWSAVHRINGIGTNDEVNKSWERIILPPESSELPDIGDTVEIVSGPFKGEKARVLKKKTNDELEIELKECVVPFPLVVSYHKVRIIKNAQKNVSKH
ncbi:MAG: KOW motif-containing protein [Candidatus Thermoplasmatota archaeon]|nr:KOW motif-containing protein [Candidatus Thermoplasmatota archaeon]